MEEKEVTSEKKTKDTWLSFKKGGIVWSVWNFVEAALFLALGVICIVIVAQGNATTDTMQTMLNIIGIFLIIGGALRILTNFMPIFASNRLEAEIKASIKDSLSYDLIVKGSVELAAGIALVTLYSQGLLQEVAKFVSSFAGIFIGVILIVAAVDFIITGIGFIVSKLYKIGLSIVEFILAAILLTLGILAIIYLQKEEVLTATILIVLGVAFLLIGIVVLIFTISTIVTVKKAAKAIKEVTKPESEASENAPQEPWPKKDATDETAALPDKSSDKNEPNIDVVDSKE